MTMPILDKILMADLKVLSVVDDVGGRLVVGILPLSLMTAFEKIQLPQRFQLASS
jgi:hypothetical protein